MRDQTMYLTLVLAVNFIEKFEAEDVFADGDLIAVGQVRLFYLFAIHKNAVSRTEIRDHVFGGAGRFVDDRMDLCVLSGDLCVVDPNVRFEGAAEYHIFALKRYRHGDKLSA